jgi:RNA polymerase sigma-70 factor (ECF subfamily)
MAEPDTEQLLQEAAGGDESARGALLQRHRRRLRKMVAVHMNPRLAARVDPSDVVQEALAEADRRLGRYLRERPLPFYPWLRQLAAENVAGLNSRHVNAQRRSLRREEGPLPLSDASVLELGRRLAARGSSPSDRLRRQEAGDRVRAALAELREADREVLVLRFLEELNAREIAAVLGVSEGAVHTRVVRALRRLRDLMGPALEGGE